MEEEFSFFVLFGKFESEKKKKRNSHASLFISFSFSFSSQFFNTPASGKRQLVVRSTPAPSSNGSGGGNKQTAPSVSLEVWGEGRCLLDLCVPPTLHGAVYSGAWFGDGGPSWSRDEERVAYVAERPERETTPEFGREDFLFRFSNSSSLDGGGEEAKKEGEEETSSKSLLLERSKQHAPLPKPWRGLGAKVEDWGEQLTGRARPGVFVLDVPSAAVLAAPSPPPPVSSSSSSSLSSEFEEDEDDDDSSSSSQGQPALSPCGKAVVYVSWPHRDENLYPGLGKQ